MDNPFLKLDRALAWGPGSFEMALPLALAAGIKPHHRVLEVGGGSGAVAGTLAHYLNVQVVTLEPWTDGSAIQAFASQLGVGNQVLALRLNAQSLPFADGSFDAVISVGSFEMIGDERPQALRELIRVARPGARFGIAEPMCHSEMPADLEQLDRSYGLKFRESFRTLEWNRQLFEEHGLTVAEARHFPRAYQWWLDYSAQGRISAQEQELIRLDGGRWLSLGMVVGEKLTAATQDLRPE